MDDIEIRFKAHIDPAWSEWFEGLTVTHNESGETLLAGSVPDQAAAYGILHRLSALGVRLISVSIGPVNTPRQHTPGH